MATRDAVSTIRGYFYQFDYSILQVLKLENDSDTVCIEGIEDVDINDENNIILHQCKCYEGTEYNHSEIKDALEWMLKHYSSNKTSDYKYYLYGVYKSGQHKLPKDIDVEFAKIHFFTKSHRDKPTEHLYQQLKLSDEEIELFLQKLTIDINAVGFEVQEKAVREELCKALSCKPQVVEPYYCTALSIIKRLATQKDSSNRTISRSQFIQEVKSANDQFEVWLINRIKTEKYVKAVKRKYFSNSISVSPFERFFLIDCKKSDSISEIKSTILFIADKYSNTSKRSPEKYCPYFFFHNLECKRLLELKKTLFSDTIRFRDGFAFQGADFSAKYLIEKPEKENPIRFRIVDKIDYLPDVFSILSHTIEIYQFYYDTPFFESQDQSLRHLKIPFITLDNIIQMV